MVCDTTGKLWITLFNKDALVLFGDKTADEAFKENLEKNNLDKLFSGKKYTHWMFYCRVEERILNGEKRQKITVTKMEPPNYIAESVYLLEKIGKM